MRHLFLALLVPLSSAIIIPYPYQKGLGDDSVSFTTCAEGFEPHCCTAVYTGPSGLECAGT